MGYINDLCNKIVTEEIIEDLKNDEFFENFSEEELLELLEEVF